MTVNFSRRTYLDITTCHRVDRGMEDEIRTHFHVKSICSPYQDMSKVQEELVKTKASQARDLLLLNLAHRRSLCAFC